MNYIKSIATYLFIFLIIVMVSCKKMDSSYKQYIVPGGLTYTAQVLSPVVYAGKNRVKITWKKSPDPNIVMVRIFWNNYADSVEVPVIYGKDSLSVIIDKLEERSYSFFARTYDDKGNRSVDKELIGASYGDQYQATLLSRPANAITFFDNNSLNIQWGAANITGGAYASDILYTDTKGNEVVKRVLVSEPATDLQDLKAVSGLRFRTVFLPDSLAIDTFYTSYQGAGSYMYDKSTWNIVGYSTQHDGSNDNRVQNIIDGKPGTRWHTWLNSQYPHFVVVDMGKSRPLSAFEIFRMTNDDRACDQFQLLVSEDNNNWTDLGIFDFNRQINDGQLYKIPSLPTARYFKFVGLKGPLNYMVLGEINVYGY